MIEVYREAATRLVDSSCAVAVTGAGVSAESDIPTFRGSGGIWERYPPEEYATIDAYVDDPDKVWKFWRELLAMVNECKPNDAHRALAELERHDLLHAVITQNIDNLHQAAGSKNVIEYHGNTTWLECLDCSNRILLRAHANDERAPCCPDCFGIMKPGVVMFGEDIPVHAHYEAESWSQRCDLMLVVGTSAQVYPASQLPYVAKARGAYIVEANIEPIDFTRNVTDAFLEGPAGETLTQLTALARTDP